MTADPPFASHCYRICISDSPSPPTLAPNPRQQQGIPIKPGRTEGRNKQNKKSKKRKSIDTSDLVENTKEASWRISKSPRTPDY